jgi:hypothetical protein
MRGGTQNYVNAGSAWGGYTGHLGSTNSASVKLAGYTGFGQSEGSGTGPSGGVKVSAGVPGLIDKHWKLVRSAYDTPVIHPNEAWIRGWNFPALVANDPEYKQGEDIDMLADIDYAAAVFFERVALDYFVAAQDLKKSGEDASEYEAYQHEFEAIAVGLRGSMSGDFETSDAARNKVKAMAEGIEQAAADSGVETPPTIKPGAMPPGARVPGATGAPAPFYKNPMVLGGIGLGVLALVMLTGRK